MSTDHMPPQYVYDRTKITAHSVRPDERARLAWMVGRSADAIECYASGTRNPPLDVLCRLATALGIHPGDFFREVEPGDLHRQGETARSRRPSGSPSRR